MTGTVQAEQGLVGEVGMTLNPTAQLPPPRVVYVRGLFSVFGDDFGGEFDFYGVHAASRIGQSRFEVSGGISRLYVTEEYFPGTADSFGKTALDINLKYLMTPENSRNSRQLRVAVGAGYSPALLRNFHGYLVGSLPLQRTTTGSGEVRAVPMFHTGVRYDRYTSPPRFDNFADNGATSRRASVFAGTEVPLHGAGNWVFVGEVQSKNNTFRQNQRRTGLRYSYSLRYRNSAGQAAGKGHFIGIGIERLGLMSDSSPFVQLGYGF